MVSPMDTVFGLCGSTEWTEPGLPFLPQSTLPTVPSLSWDFISNCLAKSRSRPANSRFIVLPLTRTVVASSVAVVAAAGLEASEPLETAVARAVPPCGHDQGGGETRDGRDALAAGLAYDADGVDGRRVGGVRECVHGVHQFLFEGCVTGAAGRPCIV